ncbi:MAG: hypothetical protein WCJ09_10865 [Planctomycetota bacterium]
MRLQTILNRVVKYKSFVYGNSRIETISGASRLVIPLRAHVVYW